MKFIGYSDEMPSLIEKYHGVILPSYREGLSKFLLEAASVGRPLVSDVPGCRDGARCKWICFQAKEC